eukprot:TRINITY_DN5961_c0_g1_i4.p1 TRINITY_DN5961_c0_g1~~TRINITY_DN5961_c0_g1_i4.p1  ORF type:complete len:202 (+),score=55.68 TRINITY_DN5961_c0_g1_i4:85-606(+)
MEVGMFAELLIKGNPKVIEPLYVPCEYEHDLFRVLRANRDALLSQRVIHQYFGFIMDRFHRIGKHGKERANKLLYHAFHKMFDLKRLLRGVPPRVVSTGAEREFIMHIREGELTGEFEESKLIARMEQEIASATAERVLFDCVNRATQTPAYPSIGDLHVLTSWLLHVRKFYP